MLDLLVIEFASEQKAENVRETLLAMRREYLIQPGDAVVAINDAEGHLKLNQLLEPVGRGAVSDAFWGSLVSLLQTIPQVGTATGALTQRLAELGLDEGFARAAARTLRSGNAALFLLIRKRATGRVLAALRGVGGTILRSAFDETKEAALQALLAEARAASAGG